MLHLLSRVEYPHRDYTAKELRNWQRLASLRTVRASFPAYGSPETLAKLL